jgi:hypothetical protein
MSKLQVDDIVNKGDDGSVGFSRGAVITGVATATSFSGNLNATSATGVSTVGVLTAYSSIHIKVPLILTSPLKVAATPVTFPLKVVAVTTPVAFTPDGAPIAPPVLPFILSTYNCDILDLSSYLLGGICDEDDTGTT